MRKELWRSGGLVGAHGQKWYEVRDDISWKMHLHQTSKRASEDFFAQWAILYVSDNHLYPGEKPGSAGHDAAKVSDVLHRHN